MGILKEEKVSYNIETLNELRTKLNKLNLIIANSKDVNKKVRAIQKRYKLEKKIEQYTRILQARLMVKEDKQVNSNKRTIRLSDLISDNFVPYFKTTRPYRILKGGRSSLKSSAVSINLVLKFISDDNANIICFRKVAKYLSTSIYEQIKWAIYLLGAEDEFTFLKSPLRIEHNRTGTAFHFFGVDDPQKIKSAKIAKGYVSDLWFEEATEFDGVEEIDTVSDTFIRQDLPDDKQVEITFTYNPPRNPYIWINEWVEDLEFDENYFIHHSDYTEDSKGFLSQQFIDKVTKMKDTDPDYHDWMYLGKVIGLGDTVYNYNLFQQINTIPDDDRLLFADIAIDTGYSTSATTFLFIGYTVKRKVIILDTYYYSPVNQINKKAPSDFSKDLFEFIERNCKEWKLNLDRRIIDSADGALRNQYNKDYGTHLTPARKKQKQKMIENVEDLLAQKRVYVLKTDKNKIFLDEHKKYQWDEKTLNTPDPKVIKIDDHTCDAFQYYVNFDLIKLGLK